MQSIIPRSPIRPVQHRLLIAACLAAVPLGVLAAPPPQIAAGRNLAQQYCAECHIVVPSGARGWTDAPAFEAIANRQGTTEKTLRAYIQQPHMHMLNTGRPPNEANEIAAYIISLRKI